MMVSLILATYGRCDDVVRMFESLASQIDKNFEVLVVDQNSDERLEPVVSKGRMQGLSITHIKMDTPNLSAARNLGVSYARGEIVAFPDDDCWYEPETIAALRNVFHERPFLDGAVGHWVELRTTSGGDADTNELSLAAWRAFRGDDASSITLFFRRMLFNDLVGFDERFGVGRWFGAAEETDFLLRALARGARLGRALDVRVHHAFGPNQMGLHSQWGWMRRRARGTGALYVKHRLSAWVVARGLIAPSVMPLLRGNGARAALLGTAVSIGRVEGLIRWCFERT